VQCQRHFGKLKFMLNCKYLGYYLTLVVGLHVTALRYGNAHFYTGTCLHRPTSCRVINFYLS